VLDPADAAMIRGFIVNKFRGDPALFEDGYRQIETLSGWRGFGVVPWLAAAARLPSEDAVVLERRRALSPGSVRIACPILPRIANFDDLDPLKAETRVELLMVPPGQPIPADADLIVLPGSKATIADMDAVRTQGWDIDILAHHRRGGMILGICGGYQMLGRRIADPHGIEGPAGAVDGLGLLDVETILTGSKALREVHGTALGARFAGYEMHLGETHGPDRARPVAALADGRTDGATSMDGQVMGFYIHDALASTGLRAALLQRLGSASDGADHAAAVDGALDLIANELESHLDIEGLLKLAREGIGG
ncbi:MAG: cobyric acid synthase, partial [Novosphingobium sp.]